MKRRLTMLLASLFLVLGTALAQKVVSGTVVSGEDGQPVIGAAVKALGSSVGTTTDIDGNFSFELPAGETKVVVSYVGMQSQTLIAGSNMKVTLKDDNKNLDEVVVVAYGTAKRTSITGSITQVDASKIENRIATSATSALEGNAPGVQVNSSYGEPGANPTISIRGIGSLVQRKRAANGAGQSPDGSVQSPLYVVDGVIFTGNIAELNPNDIENISVLKDASSAALYGNRAANGVILITTKRGKGTSKPVITLKIGQGWYTRGIKEYDRLDADTWMEQSWKAYRNYAMSTPSLAMNATDAAAYASAHLMESVQRNIYDAPDNALFDANGKLIAKRLPGYTDLDWQDAVERTGHRQEYTLSGSAAGEKFNVYSSIGYLKENGYIRNIGYERFTGRLNSVYTPNKWLQMGANLSATYSNSRFNDSATGSYFSNPFYTTRYMAPVYPYYAHNADGSIQTDADGNYVYDTTSPYLSNRNIVYELGMNSQKNTRAVINAVAFTTITLPYGFSATVKGNVDHSNTNGENFDNPVIGDGASSNGRFRIRTYQYNNYTLQELINWNHSYGLHNIDAMIGHENYSWKRKAQIGMNTGMAVDGILTIGNFLTNSYLQGANDDYKTESYLGRVRYNYDEKYFADFSFRRDGSSRFKKGHRWGDFYSFGFNWNIKKEEFLKNVKWIDQLRARASYGEVGNDVGVSLYGYQALYYIDKNAGTAALIKQSLAADNIKWETTQTLDFAVEGRLFDRLNFNIGYFDKRSKDLLFEVRMPLSAGSFPETENTFANLTQYQNIGTVSNRGWEFSFNYDVLNKKDWSWNVGLDATFLNSKIIKLPGGKDILNGLKKFSEGHSPYEYFTYHFEGVDQMTGKSLYTLDPDKKATAASDGALVTINGTDYTTDTSFGLKKWAGKVEPDVYGSISSNLRWKDLSLSTLFTYSLGGKIYDAAYQDLMSANSATSLGALHKDILNSWSGVPDGMTATSANRIDPNGTPVLDYNLSTYNNGNSDRWITSASYFIVKNITLSYNLPKVWISKWGIESLSLSAGVENAFIFTSRKGLNPQYSFTGGTDDTYVTPRVFNLGLSVSF